MLRCSANPALERPRFCLVIKVVTTSTGEGPGLYGDHSDKAIAATTPWKAEADGDLSTGPTLAPASRLELGLDSGRPKTSFRCNHSTRALKSTRHRRP